MRAGVAQGTALARLRELVLAEGGELAGAIVADPGPEALAPLVAASERCADRADDYGLMIDLTKDGRYFMRLSDSFDNIPLFFAAQRGIRRDLGFSRSSGRIYCGMGRCGYDHLGAV